MESATTSELAALLAEALSRSKTETGWTNSATLGLMLRRVDSQFSPQKFGYNKLATLLANCGDVVETRLIEDHTPPLLLVRTRDTAQRPPAEDASTNGAVVRPSPNGSRIAPAPRRDTPVPAERPSSEILNWAAMPDLPATLTALATHALDERWWFGDEIDLSFPILWNYLQFTFVRLKHENKLREIDEDGSRIAAFNTGLVDKRYEPIYALFRPHNIPNRQKWLLSSFCIAGEGRDGKDLVRNFNPLPQPPHYFSRVHDMFYDVTAGKPEVDWDHVIIKNVERLPTAFLREEAPPGFAFREPSEMSPFEKRQFFQDLSDAIKRDNRVYRAIKNRLADALDLAIKRVRWNFKTAIPHYFPREQRVNLLLPLSVVSDDQIDLALVVEKTKAGNYLGHTILTLDWAYMHARLVCRPESDWLAPSTILADERNVDGRNDPDE